MKTVIDKLAWLQIENDKVLCARSKGKSTYYIPGGKRDPGETDAQALVREIKEELTVELNPESLAFYGEFVAPADGKPEGTVVQVRCYQADYIGDLAPDSEIEELAWLGFDDIEKCSVVVQKLFVELNQKQLI